MPPGVRQGGFFRVEMDSDGVEVGHAQHQAGLIVANRGRVGLRVVQHAGAVDHPIGGAPGQGMVYALTFLVSMGVAALCVLCMRRFQLNWMGSFIMSISLIVSMAASSIVTTVIVALGGCCSSSSRCWRASQCGSRAAICSPPCMGR